MTKNRAALLTGNDVVGLAKALKQASPRATVFVIWFYWLQIIAAYATFYFYPSWWIYVSVVMFVSARQYALAVILHDAQHSHLHANKSVNNWLGRWLMAAPLGTEFTTSQKSHLRHHYRFGSPDGDPDYALYCFGRPSPKESTWQVATFLIGSLMRGQIGGMLRKHHAMPSLSRSRHIAYEAIGLVTGLFHLAQRLWTVLCVHLGLLVALTWVFGWWGYPALWAVPLATFAAFYNNFRIFCEHSLPGRDAVDPDERLISFISNPLERFFFAPAHMNYHAEHHLFPYVGYRNLPALRAAVRACPELSARIVWRPSYSGHLIAYIRALKALRLQTPNDGTPARPATL